MTVLLDSANDLWYSCAMLNRMIIVLCLVLLGCGKDKPYADISMVNITWQGYANEDPHILRYFDATMACLDTLNLHKTGYPYIIKVDNTFTCGRKNNMYGCIDLSSKTIYLYDNRIDQPEYFHAVTEHEIVHWALNAGNEAHSSIYFSQCNPYFTSTPSDQTASDFFPDRNFSSSP